MIGSAIVLVLGPSYLTHCAKIVFLTPNKMLGQLITSISCAVIEFA